METKTDPGTLGKFEALKESVGEMESVLVAFSGGVDSTFLLKVACDVLGSEKVLAVSAVSPTYPASERKEARELARDMGVHHIEIETCEMDNPSFTSNPPERCYYCKRELFQSLQRIAAQYKISFILYGANADDTGDFRPGMKAAEEMKARAPILEAGLGKEELRTLSRSLGLPTWDKPQYACLSSRIPYGTEITREALRMIEEAEGFLHRLGYKEVRVRYHGPVARIEVDGDSLTLLAAPEARERIVEELRRIGFTYVTLDLEGYRQGSMNIGLRGQAP